MYLLGVVMKQPAKQSGIFGITNVIGILNMESNGNTLFTKR